MIEEPTAHVDERVAEALAVGADRVTVTVVGERELQRLVDHLATLGIQGGIEAPRAVEGVGQVGGAHRDLIGSGAGGRLGTGTPVLHGSRDPVHRQPDQGGHDGCFVRSEQLEERFGHVGDDGVDLPA